MSQDILSHPTRLRLRDTTHKSVATRCFWILPKKEVKLNFGITSTGHCGTSANNLVGRKVDERRRTFGKTPGYGKLLTNQTNEMPDIRQRCNHKYLIKNISKHRSREREEFLYGIVAALSTVSEYIGKQYKNLATPFIEMLPGTNLLLSEGTVGSHTLFIFAFCRTLMITEWWGIATDYGTG